MTRVAAALLALTLPLAGTAIAQTTPPPAPSAATPGPAATDGNETLAAFQARQESRMLAADADHDGRVSLAEWTAAMNARRADGEARHSGGEGHGGGFDPSRMFDRMDANHDGYLNKAEIDAAAAERFQRMDSNGDGVITPDERAGQRGGGWHHGGE